MAQVVRDIKDLLLTDEDAGDDEDAHHLWDDVLGTVPGGINWASNYADAIDDDSLLGITGPDLDEPEVPW